MQQFSCSYLFACIMVAIFLRNPLVEAAGPVWNKRISDQVIPICSPGKAIQLSSTAVTDAEDGTSLQIQLLNSFNEIVAYDLSSYVYFNTKTLTLYILPIAKHTTEKTFTYKFRATDKDMNYADDVFTIQYTGSVPEANVLYEFMFMDVRAGIDEKQSFYEFMMDIGSFWNTNTLAVYSLLASSDTNIVKFLECKYFDFQVPICPQSDLMTRSYKVISNTRNGCPFLLNNTAATEFSGEFTSKTESKYYVASYKAIKQNLCSSVKFTTPYTLPQYIKSPRDAETVPLTGIFEYVLPNGVITDESETDAAEGAAGVCAILYDNKGIDQPGKPYPQISHWLGIETVAPSATTTLYAVRMDSTLEDVFRTGKNNTELGFTYSINFIRFMNNGGLFSNFQYILKVKNAFIVKDYTAIFTFRCLKIASRVYALQIKYFLQYLMQSFGAEYKVFAYMRSYHLTSYDGEDAEGSLQWSLIMTGCDYTKIEYVRNKMFENGKDGIIKASFQQLFQEKFNILTITDSLTGHCAKNPPYVNKPLPNLSISYCGVFRYKIPSETFYDKEDGTTSKMTLKLLKFDGTTIPQTDSIQFVGPEQTIVAVLSSKDTFTSRDLEYKLVATDSSGLTAETAVSITITDSPQTAPYENQIATKYSVQPGYEDINPAYVFATKVGEYFNDQGTGFLLVEHSVTSSGEEFFVFGNCTWKAYPCDVYKLKEYKEKLLNTNNLLRNEFLQNLQVEFAIPSYDTHKANTPCDLDLTPTLVNPWGPITVTTCSTYKQTIPENTFYDVEQGDTRNLECNLVTTSSEEIASNSYVYFDAATQEISILASHDTVEEQQFTLTAIDISGNEVTQQLMIKVEKQSSEPSHLVTMEITGIPSKTNMVDVGEYIRSTMMDYFKDGMNGDTFGIRSFTTVVNGFTQNSVYQIQWSNCSISTTVCDEEQIKYVRDQLLTGEDSPVKSLSPALKNFLEGKFQINSIQITDEGVCKTEKKIPTVLNPIPDQSMTFCGYFKYEIPENTFKDDIDGMTRELKLTMTMAGGSSMDELTWIEFDETEQKIYAIASHLQSEIEAPSTHTFQVTATTKRGLSARTNLNIKIIKDRNQISYAFDTTSYFMSTEGTPLSNMMKVMDIFAAFYKLTANDLYNYEYEIDDGVMYTYYFMMCTARYDPCDWDLIDPVIEKSELNGQPSTDLTNALGPEFTIIKFRGTQLETICKPPVIIPPEVVKKFETFELNQCGAFNVGFSEQTFVDEEDNTNLNLLVTHINNEAFNQDSMWIQVDGFSFTGIVPQYLATTGVKSQHFNVTVRATDSDNAYVTSTVQTTVNYVQLSSYYHYELSLQVIETSRSVLQDKIIISNALNNYLGGQVAAITSCTRNNDIITVKWKHCGLPNQCDSNMISQINDKLFDVNKKVETELEDAFLPTFLLQSIILNEDESCAQALNPPTATQDPHPMMLSVCGGFDFTIPENLFNDNEDGGTRNLKLTFTTSDGENVNDVYEEIRFDSAKQRVYGYPVLFQANFLNSQQLVLKLTATDSTGLSVTIDVPLSFVVPEIAPKYFIRFIFETTLSEADIFDQFTDKLASYTSDTSLKNIGLKTKNIKGQSNDIEYFNCSISYEPCDWASLQQLTKTFKTAEDEPTELFSTSMQSDFSILFVTVSSKDECNPTQPEPPEVIHKITIDPIFMCSAFSYTIPSNTFYDNQDGDTLNLQLSLTNAEDLNYNWLAMDNSQHHKQHLINFVLHSNTVKNQPTNGYLFTLTATDSTDLSTSFDFTVNTYGPYSLLDECQIQMELRSNNVLQASIQSYQMTLLNHFKEYFQLDSIQEIGVVQSYFKDTHTLVFHWSYCSAMYRSESYRSNSNGLEVDYNNFITKILMKLFKSDRKTLNEGFISTLFTSKGWSLQSFQTKFTERCANFPPIVPPNIPSISITIDYGGYVKYFIQSITFYDYEDGSAYDLQLQIMTSQGLVVSIDSWINIDVTTYYIIAVVNDYIRYLSDTTFVFYLRATDSSGLFTSLQVTVLKSGNIYQFAPFNVTYQLTYNAGIFNSGFNGLNLVYVNQSSYLIKLIQSYFQITNRNHILMRWFFKSTGISSRTITWSIAEHKCASSVLSTVQTLRSQTGVINQAFTQTFGTLMNIERLYYFTTCEPIIEPPVIIIPIEPPKIRFCSLFTYQLASNTFFDGYDGETPNLALTLLNQDGVAVTSSSWIQINTITMQLYAIAIRSVYRTSSSHQFSIRATNSRGEEKTVAFSTEFETSPFTSDCPITMTFRYKYLTQTTLNLDVMWRLVEMIQNFYQDQQTYIKVLSFVRTESSFTIKWSNCSSFFQFTSQQSANVGMTEEARSTITNIFSKVVTSTNVVTTNFQSYLSTYFEVITISASYCCIEKPPETKIKEIRTSAYFCKGFYERIPSNAFLDECDGGTDNLKLSLHYANGDEVNSNNWLQLDDNQKVVYGVLTEEIRTNAPIQGYTYQIKATDSTGRSSTLTFLVNVISPAAKYTKIFYFGFHNNYPTTTPTAMLLYNTKIQLQQFLNEEIYIEKYTAPGFLLWTPCSQLTCDLTSLQTTLAALQVSPYNIIPNQNFINSMENVNKDALVSNKVESTIQPYYIQVYSVTEKCIEQNITIVVTNPPPVIPIPKCGNFTFTIPNDLFYDAFDRRTKDFILSLKNASNEIISSNSWLQLNPTNQRLYGVIVMEQMSSSLTYQLEARHPVSAYTATTSITIDYPSYTTYQTYDSMICKVTTTLRSTYRTNFRDVTILRVFTKVMASYLGVSSSRILILSYTKINTVYPTEWTITWTDCEGVAILQNSAQQYFQHLQTFFSNLFVYTTTGISETNLDVFQYFQENSQFTILTIITISECDKPPNTPPKVNRPIPTQDLGCGVFEMEIPADTFIDEQQGDTRKLKLELTNLDGTKLNEEASWIALNISQFILALPTNNTIKNNPTNGYKFLLTAYDNEGLYESTTIHISFAKSQLTFLPYTQARFQLAGTNNLLSPYRVEDKIKLLKVVAPSEVYYPLAVLSYKRLQFTDNTIFFTSAFSGYITHCFCDNYEGLTFQTANIKEIVESAEPNFNIESMDVTRDQKACDDFLDKSAEKPVTLTYCMTYAYNITKEDLVPTFLLNTQIQVTVRDENEEELPSDSWVWYNYDLKIIEFFPKESFWLANQGMEFNYTYWSTEGDKSPSVKFVLVVTLPDIKEDIDQLKFSMSFQTTGVQTEPDNYYISFVIRNLQKLLPEYNVSFSDFRKLQENPMKFVIDWRICFTQEVCSALNEIFTDQNGIKESIRNTFEIGSNFQLDSISSECIDEPPQVKKQLNLTIYTCGVFKYQLPDDFAYDTQDGNMRSLKVTFLDSIGEEIPLTSWIWFEDYTFYALPTESIVNVLGSGFKQYQLVFSDSYGQVNSTTVNVRLVKNDTIFYKVSFVFNTLSSTNEIAWVQLQMKFLEYVSAFTGDNTLSYYQLIEFQQYSSTQYYIQIANCTIKKVICEKTNNILEANLQKMRKTDGSFSEDFKQSIATSFAGISIQTSSLFDVNTAPKVRKEIGTIDLMSCCNAMKFCLDQSFFTDEDFEIGKNLRYTLKNKDGGLVMASSFVQLVGSCLYILPTENIEGQFEYTLTAIDSCNDETEMNFAINFKMSCPEKFGYQSKLHFTLKEDENIYKALYDVRETVLKYFNDENDDLSLVSYDEDATNYIATFTNCSIPYPPCEYTQVNFISNKMNEIELRKQLNEIVDVISVDEERADDCVEQPPQTNRTKLIYNTTFCTKIDVQLDQNLFYGGAGETTRDYTMILLNEQKQTVGIENWLQLETSSQKLYGIPRISSTSLMERRFVYFLRATSSSGAFKDLELCVYIHGTQPDLDYQLSIKGAIQGDIGRPNMFYEMQLLTKLGTFFDDDQLNDVSFTRDKTFPSNFQFTWSFCSMRDEPCDCMFVKTTQDRIKNNDLKQAFGNEFAIQQVSYQLFDDCEKTQSPQLTNSKLSSLVIKIGQPFEFLVPQNTFTDLEDGDTNDLTICIRDMGGTDLAYDSWLRLNDLSVCGLYTITEFEQQTSVSQRVYDLVAKDNCGKEASDRFTVTFIHSSASWKYYYLMIIDIPYNEFSTNCSLTKDFFNLIQSHTALTNDMYVISIQPYINGTLNQTQIEWTIDNVTQTVCSENDAIDITTTIVQNVINGSLVTYVTQKNYPIKDARLVCKQIGTTTTVAPKREVFDWWWVILVAILLFIIFLLWFLWICIPRCWPSCCKGRGKCCEACCLPGGACSSKDDSDIYSKETVDGGEGGVSPTGIDTGAVSPVPSDHSTTILLPEEPTDPVDPNIQVLPVPGSPDSGRAPRPADESSPSRSSKAPSDVEQGVLPKSRSPILLPPFYNHHEFHRHSTDHTNIESHSHHSHHSHHSENNIQTNVIEQNTSNITEINNTNITDHTHDNINNQLTLPSIESWKDPRNTIGGSKVIRKIYYDDVDYNRRDYDYNQSQVNYMDNRRIIRHRFVDNKQYLEPSHYPSIEESSQTTDDDLYVVRRQKGHRHKHHFNENESYNSKQLVLVKDGYGYTTTNTSSTDRSDDSVTLTIPKSLLESYLEKRWRENKDKVRIQRRSKHLKTNTSRDQNNHQIVQRHHYHHHDNRPEEYVINETSHLADASRDQNNHEIVQRHHYYHHDNRPVEYVINETSHLADALVDNEVISPRRPVYLRRSASLESIDRYKHRGGRARKIQYVYRRRGKSSDRHSHRHFNDKNATTSSSSQSYVLVPYNENSTNKLLRERGRKTQRRYVYKQQDSNGTHYT